MSEAVACPVCRASNAAGPACRRCKADLSLLFALAGQRAEELGAAYRRAAHGEWREADAHARRAEVLRDGDDVRRLRAVIALMRRDFVRACELYAVSEAEA